MYASSSATATACVVDASSKHDGHLRIKLHSQQHPHAAKTQLPQTPSTPSKGTKLSSSSSSTSSSQSWRRQYAETIKTFQYNARTIWLITRNDLKSIVLPETAFGIFTALARGIASPEAEAGLTGMGILSRLPQVVLWNWLNCLLFDIANQRLPDSIMEDRINKPWRVLPAGRMSPEAARRLLLAVCPVVFLTTWLWLGGLEESVWMMVLTWMYNDLAGADENYIVRNAINSAGFMCYSSGATLVATGLRHKDLSPAFYMWLAIVGAIVFTTLQMQDMADQVGDAERGRRTFPLVHGDGAARWSIALPVLAWSVVCPAFWASGVVGWALSMGFGSYLSYRVVTKRGVDNDKVTWRLWCYWTGALYLLPLVST